MASSLCLNYRKRFGTAACLPIGTIRCEDVISVRNRDYSRLKRDGLSDQTMGVTTTINTLVVVKHGEQISFEMSPIG
jgi:hypothetical protein